MGKYDQRGNKQSDHYAAMRIRLMKTEAWRALTPKAQALYPWLKLEWKGNKFNNNGKIRLSCRQAASRMGVSVNTAAQAFRELQAKGFLVVTKMGALGVEGEARGPSYELTEIGLPGDTPRALYLRWRIGADFDVVRHNSNSGTSKKNQKPV